MRRLFPVFAVAGLVVTCLALTGSVCRGSVQYDIKVAKSSRGGLLTNVEGHQFEVFCYPTGLRVFLLDKAGKPVDVLGLSGHATFYHPNDPDSPWFSRPLHHSEPGPDHMATSLDLSVDLSEAPKSGATVHFEIVGLESKNSSTANFRVPLQFVAPPGPPPVVAARRVGSESVATRVTVSSDAPMQTTLSSIAPPPALTPLSYVQPANVPATVETDGYRTFGMRNRDWSTGRTNLPLSRPWLAPRY